MRLFKGASICYFLRGAGCLFGGGRLLESEHLFEDLRCIISLRQIALLKVSNSSLHVSEMFDSPLQT